MDAAKYRPDDPEVFGEPGDPPDAEPFASAAVAARAPTSPARCASSTCRSPRAATTSTSGSGRCCATIPYGETRSYGDLARALGDRNLAQAVGTANGRNPIAVVVPCHRVIGADGSLVGYAGGLDRKRYLLALEEPSADHAGRLF